MQNRRRHKHANCFKFFAEKKRLARLKKKTRATENAPAQREPLSLYDSPEEQAFCEKFNVSGKLEIYNIWHQFAEALPEHLRQETFRRMILELRDMFGLQRNNSLCADEYYSYRDERTAELHLHGKKNAAGDLLITVDELEIWRDHHLVTLIEEVHLELKLDAAVLYEFADNWFNHILDIIDEARDQHQLTQLYDTDDAKHMARTRLSRVIESRNDQVNTANKL